MAGFDNLCTCVLAQIRARTQVHTYSYLWGTGLLFLLLPTAVSAQCLEVAADSLRCDGPALRYSFRFTNHSPNPVNAVRVLPTETPTADVLLTDTLLLLDETVGVGQTSTQQIDVRFLDVDNDGAFCFDAVLRQLVPERSIAIFCCFGTVCVDDQTPFPGGGRPRADAGPAPDQLCGEPVQLDGSASRPPPGPDIAYRWRSTAGTLLSGDRTTMPFVEGAGDYRLLVSNALNGCADSATVTLTENSLLPAELGPDRRVCDLPLEITGNQPPGTTGAWSALNDAGATWTASGPTATVRQISTALSLIYTLSTPDCPDYDSDTLRLFTGGNLTARNDTLTRFGGDGVGEVDLLANDDPTSGVTVRLLNDPGFGLASLDADGRLTLTIDPCTFDDTTIDYEITDNNCATATARATVFIRSDPGNSDDRYNVITPDGDGLNEVFVFEEIEQCPELFPDRRITIFNRWGDVLYEAAPYNNDWDGTYLGTPVPEGTYYYILWLDLGEGKIVRGDVTVLR